MNRLGLTKPVGGSLKHLALAVAMASGLIAGTALAAPANDNFANAINLPDNTGTQTGTDSIDATLEVGEPNPGSGALNTVWFQWTSPADGNFTVSTLGSTNAVPAEFDAVLGIYRGASLNALTALPGTPQDTLVEEAMTAAVIAGTTYFIQVGGFENQAATNIRLSWSFAATIYQADILTFGPGAVVGPVVSNAAGITWNVSPGTNLATLAPTFTLSPGATCTVGGLPVNSGDPVNFSGSPVVFTVTAQGVSPVVNNYTVTAVAGKVVLWDLDDGGDWDFTTSNWFGQVSGSATTFANGDAVIFNKSEGGSIFIPSTVMPFSTTVGSPSGDYYVFTGASIAGAGSLTKEGSSTVSLASPNTYSGATVVNGGTLVAIGNTSIGGSTSFTVADGAELRLLGATVGPYKWPAAVATLSGAGTVTVAAPGLLNTGFRFDMSAFTGVLKLNGGQFSVNPFYSPGFVSPAGGTIEVGSDTTLYLGWTGSTFNTTVKISSGIDNGENLGVLRGDTATLNGAVILATNSTIGSAGGTLTINASISDGGNGFGFTKVGGGTVILTAATNTYTGPTVVNSATLQCDTPGALGGGALSINDKLNLNYSGNKTVASLTLAGSEKGPGVYGSSSSPAPLENQDDSRFAGTGTVTVKLASGFADWAAANAPGQTADQDHDNDGVKNGIEYFMGETGSSFTAMPGLDGTNTVTWTMAPAYEGTYEVQTSPDLGTWTNVDPRPLPAGGNLSYLLPIGKGIQFVRLLVTPTP